MYVEIFKQNCIRILKRNFIKLLKVICRYCNTLLFYVTLFSRGNRTGNIHKTLFL